MLNGNTFGNFFRITTFGESHGAALGVVIDGCPAGLELDMEGIRTELARRRPGQTSLVSPRQEADDFKLLSGTLEGRTTGCPLAFVVENTDQRSRDYSDIAKLFRPGHADFTYFAKYGHRDYRGGGRSSARETVSRVLAGAIAKQLLLTRNIIVRGGVVQVGKIKAANYCWEQVESNELRSVDPEAVEAMKREIQEARTSLDSVGGIVEVQALNVPPGWGEPVFEKLDASIAAALMSIPAVKGIEIGDGFKVAEMRGSQANDEFFPDGFHSNSHGGILGGISSGAPIIARFALKPTSSLPRNQRTIDTSFQPTEISTKGRHDPCVAIRAVPVGEAMLALVLVDLWLQHEATKGLSFQLMPRPEVSYVLASKDLP